LIVNAISERMPFKTKTSTKRKEITQRARRPQAGLSFIKDGPSSP